MEFEDTIASLEADEQSFDKADKESKRRYAKQLEALILMYQDACQHAILQDGRSGAVEDPCVNALNVVLSASPARSDLLGGDSDSASSPNASRNGSSSPDHSGHLTEEESSPAKTVRMNKASMMLKAR